MLLIPGTASSDRPFFSFAILILTATAAVCDGAEVKDCFPEPGSNKEGCIERGCLWVPVAAEGQPFCRVKNDCLREGKPASSQEECSGRGCVWSPTKAQGAPWCHEATQCFKKDKPTQKACYDRGCVWAGSEGCRYEESDPIKIDCQPENYRLDLTRVKADCLNKGCIWDDKGISGQPYCYFDAQGAFGYEMVGKFENKKGIRAILKKRGKGSVFGNDYDLLNITVRFLTDDNVQILIEDAKGEQPAVPHDTMKAYVKSQEKSAPINPSYRVEVTENPFSIKLVRRSSGVAVFNTENLVGPVYSKRYLQMSTLVPTSNLYGIGEHAHNSFRRNFNWKYWPLFSRDFPPIGAGEEHWNLYSVHPFYTAVEKDGSAHGVLLMNAHAMSLQLQPDPNVLTYRTVGGKLDFHVYMGPGPDSVIQQYTAAVGRSYMPPYWTLGYQLSRWGYGNTETIEKVHDRNRRAGIPMDVHYLDIDYMAQYWDFTYDGNAGFKELPRFTDKVHKDEMKMVLILDPGVPSDVKSEYYAPLKDGLSPNIFIKTNASGTSQSFEGSCWPGLTYWPDFTDPNAYKYWLKQHQDFHKQVPFDGMWYDMNEPSNFKTETNTLDCKQNDLNFPPYAPNKDRNLNWKTICMDAYQHLGRHYDLHSLYGFFEAKVSHDVLKEMNPGKRPFLISRSTFPGAGAFGAHWTGDVYSQWYQLKLSVIGILDFNLFGIPQVGADICGFNGATNEDLCIRWHQLGAFYPYSRNHNTRNIRDQDPAAWSPDAMEIMKSSIQLRYRMLPYLYTLFHLAHTQGSTVARPLFFEFPNDLTTLNDAKGLAVDTQFMLGPSIMVTPVLWEHTLQREAYFPQGRWFHLVTGEEVQGAPGHVKIDTPKDQVSAYLRGGHVLPLQKDNVTTASSRRNPMQLLIGLDGSQNAQGMLYWDDGESLDTFENGHYDLFRFNVHSGQESITIEIKREHRSKTPSDTRIKMDTITIYGSTKQPKEVQAPEGSKGHIVAEKNAFVIKNLNLDIFGTEDEFIIQVKF